MRKKPPRETLPSPMIQLPPLYPLTDAGREPSLSAQVRAFGESGLPLVQFRGKPLDAKTQYDELRSALQQSFENGGWPMICVNDRADLALLAAREGLIPWGLHLGQMDLPPSEARRLPGLERLHIGTSTHGETEWSSVDAACDHAGVGPFRATSSKSDHAGPIGLEGLRMGCRELRLRGMSPIAIGGLKKDDFDDVFAAGAASVALITELDREDPANLAWAAQLARWQARPPFHKHQGLALVGSSGAGKSTLATVLAPRLGLSPLDLDALIEAKTGKGIPQLFEELGEPGFRSLEEETLAASLGAPSVIALGGGAWESSGIRRALDKAGFQTLWIAETPQNAWTRVAADPTRPLARDRTDFFTRHRARMQNWADLPCVLPLGREAIEIAGILAAG